MGTDPNYEVMNWTQLPTDMQARLKARGTGQSTWDMHNHGGRLRLLDDLPPAQQDIHKIDITPQMRKDILQKGQPISEAQGEKQTNA